MIRKLLYATKRRLVYRRGWLHCIQCLPVLMGLAAEIPAQAATIDLGIVGRSTQLNATITDTLHPMALMTYSYNQLVFQGSQLGLVLDGGMTVGDVLANDLGAVDPGSLAYNFPSTPYAASGTYTQTSSGEPPTVVTLVATSVSGHVNPNNGVGGQISVDITKAGTTYLTILNLAGSLSNYGGSSVTVTTLALGTIGSNVYQGESVDTTWQVSAAASPATNPATAPEPATLWFAAGGCTAVLFLRRRQRRRPS